MSRRFYVRPDELYGEDGELAGLAATHRDCVEVVLSGAERVLVEALEPFARFADAFDGWEPPLVDDVLITAVLGSNGATVGDLRQARAALETASGDVQEGERDAAS